MGANLDVMLARVRGGEIDFGAFVAGTRAEFRAMAMHLMRRWRLPEWMIVDDVEQELYLGAWRCIPKFDPARGVSLARFVVFGAMSSAKREMHKARGVSTHGNPDKKPSRLETPVSFLGREPGDGDALVESLLAEPATAEREIIDAETTRRAATNALRACANKKERYAVLAIREAGSLDNAGRLLYDDVDHRTTLRLGSEDVAERFIVKHAGAVAHRMMVECVI